MPLPFLLTSSDGFVGGGQYSRFKGAVLAGTFVITSSAGTLGEGVAGVGLVQGANVTSTLGVRVQVLSTLPAAISAANYVYIPQSSGAIATSSAAAGDAAPPLSGMGAAIMWDAGRKTLGVFSTINNAWLFITNTSSNAGTAFTSS